MFIKPEDSRTAPRLVATDSLENAEAIVQGVGKDVNGCLVPVNKLSIHPDLFGLRYHEVLFIPISGRACQLHPKELWYNSTERINGPKRLL